MTARPSSPARRWAQLVFGLLGWGAAAALMIRSGLGVGPWDAFHQGLHLRLGVGIGVASVGVGLSVLLLSLPFGIRPGAGTLANMVLIGATIDVLLPVVPPAAGWGWGLAYHLGGIALAGWMTGAYIGAGLGSGPRDGLVLEVARRTARPVRRVRTAFELSALAGGWALGGRLGVGTVLFAVLVGPAMQWGLRRWGVGLPAPAPAAAPAPLARAA
ncbi:hypothetical protein [Roseisolibacter sp. H3M3-2]|uniref:YczE/YyaS/YitT family protein n=1 Tax=Roseisolibacter sp. H3M3-2 TaxID=3031323 RepID=UPI0023DB0A06|nr:hypothetical protein [Roseisolibacter sp. H3M3-2]MDF1502563.1 hypothetical protein [Roseisolibacter sp. H3M3-2]